MNSVETQMQVNTVFSRTWLLARFRGITPLTIRKKYKLAEKGDYFFLCCYMIYDVCSKSIGVFKSLFHRDPVKKEYNRLLKKINSRVK